MDPTLHKLGELFCGPGGIAAGARKASAERNSRESSIEHVWATDYHHDTCETYRDNFFPTQPERVIEHDIRTLDMKRLGAISEIDALAFGFPCNDFSVVGEQKGTDGDYGPLYSYGVRALKLFRPKWFLAENVSGLTSSNEGSAFVSILEDLRKCGYDLFPHLYKFEDYGVPQARHRIIIIGIREDLQLQFKIPSPSGLLVSSREALTNIPDWASNQELTKQASQVVERLNLIKPGHNAFTADLPPHLRLNVRGAKISQIYKRLDPSKPSYTVTGSGGGGTHMYHWSEPRALTNRERARLQTFPDDFVFRGGKESVRRQIGMAVPVDGVAHIFRAILDTFDGRDYPHTAPVFSPLFYDDQDETIRASQTKILEETQFVSREVQ